MMVKLRIAYTLGIALVALTAAAPPATWAGNYSTGGGFTAPGYGARQWGMGGAAIARGADEGALYWNPSLLARMPDSRVGFSYIDLIPGADAQQTHFAWAQILKRGAEHEPGLSFNQHVIGIVYSNLGLTLADDQTYAENVLRIAYSWAPRYFFSVGASFGMLFSSTDVPGFSGDGTTIDVGARLALFAGTTVAFSFRNAASQLDYEDGFNVSLPRVLTLGLAYEDDSGISMEGDLVFSHSALTRVVIGGEAILFERVLHLRGGLGAFNTGAVRVVPYAGMGIEFFKTRLDYNANLDTEDAFGNTHRFSLGIGF